MTSSMFYIEPLHVHLTILTSKGFVDHYRFMEQIKNFEIWNLYHKLWICYIKIYIETFVGNFEKWILNTILSIVDTNDMPQYLLQPDCSYK